MNLLMRVGLEKHVIPLIHDRTISDLCSAATELYDQTKWLLIDGDDESNDSESETDSSYPSDEAPARTMHDLVEQVKTYTDCLIDLGTALKCPALDPEPEDEARVVRSEQRAAHDYHTDLIMARFPQAQLALLQTLGKTSWNRYQRMQQERCFNVQMQSAALARAKSEAAASEFQDSGLGTSLPQVASAYAETIASFVSKMSGDEQIKIPTLSAEAKSGIPFECIACGSRIRITSNREWR